MPLSLHRPLPGARLRLLCLAHAGGGASAFSPFREPLAAAGIELCALQAPGRENRLSEPPASAVEPLIAHYSEALATLPALPQAVLGHSLGALLGWRLAQALEARCAPPTRLIASAARSPSSRTQLRYSWQLPDDQFLAKVIDRGGIPVALREQPSLLAMFLPALRADYRLFDTWLYRADSAPLKVPVSVWLGRADEDVGDGADWAAVCAEAPRVRCFEGGHFYLYRQREAVVAALVEELLPRPS